MNCKRGNAAAGVVHAAMENGKRTAAGIAAALDAAGLLMSPETAAELERLRARVAELETERHTTNEALSEAAEALRADRDRIAELEQREARDRAAVIDEAADWLASIGDADAAYLLRTCDVPPAAECSEAGEPELTAYRASIGALILGRYTTVQAAREHCEAYARREPNQAGLLNWVLHEPDEDDSPEELTVGGTPTGYVVTPLTVASRYDEDGDE